MPTCLMGLLLFRFTLCRHLGVFTIYGNEHETFIHSMAVAIWYHTLVCADAATRALSIFIGIIGRIPREVIISHQVHVSCQHS